MTNVWMTQDWTSGQLNALVKLVGGEETARAILAGTVEFKLVEKVQTPEPPLDTIIRVDRSIRPVYPGWVKTVQHPDLEPLGPAEFDASRLELWLHEGQSDNKYTKGHKIYEHLKEKKILEDCLGLRDLEEIQKKGLAFFRKFFKGKTVFGWKSVVLDRYGSLRVPYLCGSGDKVVLDWRWLGSGWGGNNPALRFAS